MEGDELPHEKKIIERKEWGPWTVPEYALLFSVSRATVHHWIGKGLLGSAKIGGSRRIFPAHDKSFRERFGSQGGES